MYEPLRKAAFAGGLALAVGACEPEPHHFQDVTSDELLGAQAIVRELCGTPAKGSLYANGWGIQTWSRGTTNARRENNGDPCSLEDTAWLDLFYRGEETMRQGMVLEGVTYVWEDGKLTEQVTNYRLNRQNEKARRRDVTLEQGERARQRRIVQDAILRAMGTDRK